MGTATSTNSRRPVTGAADALRTRLRDCLPALRRFGRNLTGNEADGDELVQEVCVKALERADRWDRDRPLQPWLLGMMHNLHIDRYRAASRNERHLRQFALETVDRWSAPKVEARLNLRVVARAMETLSADRRAILLLICVEGLSYREAADALDLPIGTVMSRLNRARNDLLSAIEAPSPPLSMTGNAP